MKNIKKHIKIKLYPDNANHILTDKAFPLSSKYNPDLIFANQMGPHMLWLLEWIISKMHIKPGMHILDMGCGKAITSIFLAKEFGVSRQTLYTALA